MKENSNSPIYIAQASRCYKNRGVSGLRDAQRSVVNGVDVLPGPNTDDIGRSHRWDGCHLSTEGLDMAANMWIDAIK
jgi:hypothetical protein